MSIAVTMLTALNPVNMPNPARIRFGCGQLWPLRPASVRNRPGSDLVLGGHVRLWPNGSGPEASRCARICRPGFGKRQPARFWQNATGPDLIWFWVAMSGCGQTDPGRKEAVVQEYPGRFQHVYWECFTKHSADGSGLPIMRTASANQHATSPAEQF